MGQPLSPHFQDLGPQPHPCTLLGTKLHVPSAPQKDPANADYTDLFLFSNALAEEATSSALGLSKHQNPASCPMAPLEEVCDRKLAPSIWKVGGGAGGCRSRGGQQLPEETF